MHTDRRALRHCSLRPHFYLNRTGRRTTMIKYFLFAFATVATAAAWATLVFFAASEGWGREPLTSEETPEAFLQSARRMIESENVGNVGLAVIEQGRVVGHAYASVGEPINGSSLFQVASLSKWLTAWGVMVLVEEGLIDLDTPVSTYLSRWRLPDSSFDNDGVTVRRLLSHTSGLDDALGYAGFDSREDVESLEASLTKASDASPGRSGVVRVGREPGSGWAYSGGGYTLLQLLIEEVSDQSFTAFMKAKVFSPLGLDRTTFDHAAAEEMGLAENYSLDGAAEPLRWYTAVGAASLFTTVDDLAAFLSAQAPQSDQSVLSDSTLKLMRTSHATQMGVDTWGLGVILYTANGSGDYIVGHDGNNEPAINTSARIDPATGDGIVVLATGSPMLATRLAGEWVFWKTGNVDNLMFVLELERTIIWMAVGALVILLTAVVAGLVHRRRMRREQT